jgi:hypothetical protein
MFYAPGGFNSKGSAPGESPVTPMKTAKAREERLRSDVLTAARMKTALCSGVAACGLDAATVKSQLSLLDNAMRNGNV